MGVMVVQSQPQPQAKMCRTGTNFSEQRSKHTFSVQGPSSLDEQEA
ncbi:hypothetical protein NSND_50776 [Nitrospira sp. ND1]|nr:hypothetical protein NSND_50776 [Nitrospira sp. ND1]